MSRERETQRDKKERSEDMVQISDYPTTLEVLSKCVSDEGQDLESKGGMWHEMRARGGEEGATFLCGVDHK